MGGLEQDGENSAVATECHLTFLAIWLVKKWDFVKLLHSESFLSICQDVRSYSEGEENDYLVG